ncbi:hypothetical protein ScPMuIL_018468 [Solemya velum]
MAAPMRNSRFLLRNILIRFHHVKRLISNGKIRVRFAPSPTGMLHLGGLRTALYNFLFARSQRGTFILRIEDTDQTRLVPGAVQRLEEMLNWVGITPDEGPTQGGDWGPYIQSQRLQTYQEEMDTLLKNRTTYRCFCTTKRLELLRKEALRRREVPKYDGRCRHLSEEEVTKKLEQGLPSVIRLKLESLHEPWEDLVYGPININITDVEGDPILMKTDGYPTYHFANVVDDHHMGVTHVLRGVEWQTSTPKHLLLYRAFGWEPPKFAHLPLIMNRDGTKLSKRQGDIQVDYFKENGYFSDAVLNYITQMGGGFNVETTEGLVLDELIDEFSVRQLNRNSGRLDTEKLNAYNRLHLQRLLRSSRRQDMIQQTRDMVRHQFQDRLGDSRVQEMVLEDEHISDVLEWSQTRIHRLEDLLAKNMEFIWIVPKMEDLRRVTKLPLDTDYCLEHCINSLRNAVEFSVDSLSVLLRNDAKDLKVKFSDYMKLLRGSLSGLQEGPAVAEMLVILGKGNSVARLHQAASILKQKVS